MGKSTTLYILIETAGGYALGQVKEWDQIGADADSFAQAVADVSQFKQIVSIVAFHGFVTAEEALENMVGPPISVYSHIFSECHHYW
ncbi:MAG: uncharacterized protein KVP18_002926 [Porospora cf. gigantea A]|uniref:uncharacterized protein n=1 Tax=Porospora cf. gigantea A TaxID=2853593 RepID=UPI00355A3FDC|nr:MAG: hypothetical protein KVP18_002926 [Porospora cf. gigantea A]